MEKKLDGNYTRILWANLQPSWKLSKLDVPDMQNTAGEVGTNSLVTYSCGPLHMDEQRQDNQQEPTYSCSLLIQDVALKAYGKWWTIEKGGMRGSGRSMLLAWRDDDGDISQIQNIQIMNSCYEVC